MTCDHFADNLRVLSVILRHIQDVSCTECAQEYLDHYETLFDHFSAVLREIDLLKSELEATRLLERRRLIPAPDLPQPESERLMGYHYPSPLLLSPSESEALIGMPTRTR